MGKTVNYQCNLGISKVIETLDEDENIVEGLSQEAGPSENFTFRVFTMDVHMLRYVKNWKFWKRYRLHLMNGKIKIVLYLMYVNPMDA